MKSYLFALLFSASFFSTLHGDYTSIKKQIEVFKEELAVINDQETNYEYCFRCGTQSGLKSSLLVINMWLRDYSRCPYSPPISSIKRDMFVLMSVSSELSYEEHGGSDGFVESEEFWFEQGIRHGLAKVIYLLEDN